MVHTAPHAQVFTVHFYYYFQFTTALSAPHALQFIVTTDSYFFFSLLDTEHDISITGLTIIDTLRMNKYSFPILDEF